jgi:hypothetical protein
MGIVCFLNEGKCSAVIAQVGWACGKKAGVITQQCRLVISDETALA